MTLGDLTGATIRKAEIVEILHADAGELVMALVLELELGRQHEEYVEHVAFALDRELVRTGPLDVICEMTYKVKT